MTGTVLVVTGTGTGVGKTVVTAAIAALATTTAPPAVAGSPSGGPMNGDESLRQASGPVRPRVGGSPVSRLVVTDASGPGRSPADGLVGADTEPAPADAPGAGGLGGRPAGDTVALGVGSEPAGSARAARLAAPRPRVAVLKPAQTGVAPGEPGDLAEVARLVPGVTIRELGRFPDPLAPATAARRAGLEPVHPAEAVAAARELAADHDLVLIEGAGGLLVRFDGDGGTLADVAASLGAPVLVVAAAGLGTLNHTELSVRELHRRGLTCAGIVIGSWPAEPDLASCTNLHDLPAVTGVPLLGALPAGAGAATPEAFVRLAHHGLAPELGGGWQTPPP